MRGGGTMSNDKTDLDYICTAVGALILAGLVTVWIVLALNGIQADWRTLAVPGTIGLVLMLPFSQLRQLLRALNDLTPFGGGDAP